MSEAKTWDKFYINGAWIAPQGEGKIEVHALYLEKQLAKLLAELDELREDGDS